MPTERFCHQIGGDSGDNAHSVVRGSANNELVHSFKFAKTCGCSQNVYTASSNVLKFNYIFTH